MKNKCGVAELTSYSFRFDQVVRLFAKPVIKELN